MADLCLACAEWAFARWREPMRSASPRMAIPDVPVLSLSAQGEALCPRCGGFEAVTFERIQYRTYSGPYCTGLPDYFYLTVRDQPPTEWELRVLGIPYIKPGTGRCPMDSLAGLPLLSDEWSVDRRVRPWSSPPD